MCNCKNTEGFAEKLHQANLLTEETGETHVVYTINVPNHGKHAFLRKETALTDGLGICCYTLPDGTEKEYKPTNEIIVTDATTVSKPKSKVSKKTEENTSEPL